MILDERKLPVYVAAITPLVRCGRMTLVCAPLPVSYLVLGNEMTFKHFKFIQSVTYRTLLKIMQPDEDGAGIAARIKN